MGFRYKGRDEGLKQAVEYCNRLYENEGFWEAVRTHESFDHARVTPSEIHDFMRGSDHVVSVRDWTPSFWKRLFYTNTVGLTSATLPSTILYHTRFRTNSVASKVNTIVHEHVHVIDYFSDNGPDIHFGHVGQSRSGNERTAPYAIGAIAEAFYRAESTHPTIGFEAMGDLTCASFCEISDDELDAEPVKDD